MTQCYGLWKEGSVALRSSQQGSLQQEQNPNAGLHEFNSDVQRRVRKESLISASEQAREI